MNPDLGLEIYLWQQRLISELSLNANANRFFININTQRVLLNYLTAENHLQVLMFLVVYVMKLVRISIHLLNFH